MWQGKLAVIGLAALLSSPAITTCAQAQQTTETAQVTFGGLKGDPELPVTVTSQTLTLDEGAGTAVFTGDALAVQGNMRLRADELRAFYNKSGDKVEKIIASGNVVLVNVEDAAQAQTAEYDIAKGLVTMQGQVVLTQGPATMTSAKLIADLTTGHGQLSGGVTTVFTPSAAP